MKDYSNLRSHERTDFDTPVVYSKDNLETHQKAMMHNFSDHGMYFESGEPLRPGSEIFVKTVNYCSINKCQVKWCGRIDDEGQETFGIGLECEI